MNQQTLTIHTSGRGLTDITQQVARVIAKADTGTGLCHLFLQHTSASLVIQENADPAVLRDLEDWFARQVPDGDPRYRHAAEGPDDMPAHIRAAITATSLTIPIASGRLALGTWQGIYLYEHRTHPHRRRVVVTAIG
jgi:secondary thiamine-phosphate synthase enzyme